MDTSNEPDVNRVLIKMGRAEFGYRNFDAVPVGANSSATEATPEPLDEVSGRIPQAVKLPHDAGTTGTVFSLLGEAIPEAACVSVAPGSPSEHARAVTAAAPQAQVPSAPEPPASAPAPWPLAEPRYETPANHQDMGAERADVPQQPPTSTSNPFPPRTVPPPPLATYGLTPMTTVFQILAGHSSDTSSTKVPRANGSGFPFQRG